MEGTVDMTTHGKERDSWAMGASISSRPKLIPRCLSPSQQVAWLIRSVLYAEQLDCGFLLLTPIFNYEINPTHEALAACREKFSPLEARRMFCMKSRYSATKTNSWRSTQCFRPRSSRMKRIGEYMYCTVS